MLRWVARSCKVFSPDVYGFDFSIFRQSDTDKHAAEDAEWDHSRHHVLQLPVDQLDHIISYTGYSRLWIDYNVYSTTDRI